MQPSELYEVRKRLAAANCAVPSGFRLNVEVSRLYERWFTEFLVARGYHVNPIYNYTGSNDNKAPKLIGATPYVLPDFLAAKDGRSMWIEFKQKTSATFTYRTGRHETGFHKRHLIDYLAVSACTGLPVHVVFAHETVCSFERLRACPRFDDSDQMARGGMAFWPVDELPILLKPWAPLSRERIVDELIGHFKLAA